MTLTTRTKSIANLGEPRIAYGTFLGIGWGGTVLSFIFLIGRLATRWTVHRALYVDDFFVIAAWFMLLANTIIWQVVARDLYQNMLLTAGLIQPPPSFPEDTTRYLRASTAVIILFYSGLWFVKFAFLSFFRRLGNRVRTQTVHWWIVAGLTFGSWLITFGTLKYDCLTSPFEYIISQCISDSTAKFLRSTLLYNMAMDVITDAAIITIPVHLLWNVRISLRQKLALMSIFSLTIFIMIFAIVRATVVSSYSSQPDQTWLYMWSSIEQTVSILIACLASFRSLFTKTELAAPRQPRDIWPSWHRLGSSTRNLLSKLTGPFASQHTRRESEIGSYQHSPPEKVDFPDKNARSITTAFSSPPTVDPPTNSIHISREFSTTSQAA